jgi:hypothetical protein
MAAGLVSHNITTASGVTFAVVSWVPDTTAPDVGAVPVARITDGTNVAAVKAASTAAVATDPAVVVALSPNGLNTNGTTTDANSAPVAWSTEGKAQVGSVTETAPATDTASSGLNGRLQRIAQRLTSMIALLPTALGAGGGLKVDGSGTTLPVGGTVATNVAITGNPLNLGAQAVSSENAAVTAGRQVQLVADLVGKTIVLPYANPENFVSGAITTAMTGTTTTSLLAAPAAGLRNYITQITVSNAHATVGTDVIIQDGSGGTTLYTIPAAAVYGGAVITFPTPLRQPTTATAIFCANVITGASTKVSASGYKGA